MVVNTRTENGTVYEPVQKKDLEKFPRAVFLIILNEFCERFSYSGMRAFLALYLKQKLFYTEDEATEVYHIFTTMAYFFSIFGAILADSFFGKFRTIIYLMVVYAAGNIILTVTAVPTLGIPGREFTIIGLMMVALGTGGIKPCVSSFGGDQFVLPQQEKQLTTFFSILYFILCLASLIAKSVSPLLRSEVQCFGHKDCFSLAFGAPGILIIISIIIFTCGKKMYIIKKPTGNIMTEAGRCIYESFKRRRELTDAGKKYEHWLDYARGSYDLEFINNLKRTFRVFVLFTPLPVFWALLDQLGSRWTLQAARMDGRFWFFTVKPDQIQVLCPISLLLLIPVFKKVIYPSLGKFGLLTKPLERLLLGCAFAAVSYIFTGLLELRLEKTYPVLPSEDLGQLRIYNGYNCKMYFENTLTEDNFTVNPLDIYANKFIQVERNQNLLYNRTMICPEYNSTSLEKIHVEENKAISYFYRDDSLGNATVLRYNDHVDKSRSGLPYVRILANIVNKKKLEILLKNKYRGNIELWTNSTYTELIEVFSGEYELFINSKLMQLDMDFRIGGVYTIIINDINEYNAQLLTVTEPNSVSVAWVLPQMIIISAGEVLFAITGLEFAFKEAPESMKAVLQAYWLLVEAVGNIIIIIVTRLGTGYRQAQQFFFFAGLMFGACIVFYFLAKRHERHKELDDEVPIRKKSLLADKYIEIMQIDDTLDH